MLGGGGEEGAHREPVLGEREGGGLRRGRSQGTCIGGGGRWGVEG